MNEERAEERRAFIQGLRELANFVENTPELRTPCGADFYIFARNPDEFSREGIALGNCRKSEGGQYVNLYRNFGPHKLEVTGEHEQVCIRKVIGVEKVTEKVPTGWEERTVEKEIIRWDCPQVLGGGNE